MKPISILVLGLLAATAPAQDATLTALHGVPNLPAPVTVLVNGSPAFSFAYGEQVGPLALAAGPYTLDVQLNGSTILSATANLAAGTDYSAIAHLDAGGTPRLALFTNDLSPLSLPQARLLVRHTAQAPAVDVVLEQGGAVVGTLANLTNGQEAAVAVAPGRYAARLNVAGTGTTAFGPVEVVLEDGYVYGLFAVGDVTAPDFTLLAQRGDGAARVTVVHGIPGLPAPVSVQANGSALFQFDFKDVRGPLAVAPASYTFDVVLNGSPVLTLPATLARGDDVTVVAHLDAAGQPSIAAFANDLGRIASRPGARVAVRHLAQAPAVDVAVDQPGGRLATIPMLGNGSAAVAELPLGRFQVSLLAANTTNVAFGPVDFRPGPDEYHQFLAVGSLAGGSFDVLALRRDLGWAVPGQVNATMGGISCGPMLMAMPMSFDYGEPFTLRLMGAPADAAVMVVYGNSNTGVGGLALPLALMPFGAPGCFLYTDAVAVLMAQADAAGGLDLGYVVPRALFGTFPTSYFQVGALSNANALGVVTSGYVELR